MARNLAVLLFFCLSVQPACALNINWQERVQRFSQYVDAQSVAQGQRSRFLGMQAQSFTTRVQGYVRALEDRARPFQSAPPASAGAQK